MYSNRLLGTKIETPCSREIHLCPLNLFQNSEPKNSKLKFVLKQFRYMKDFLGKAKESKET